MCTCLACEIGNSNPFMILKVTCKLKIKWLSKTNHSNVYIGDFKRNHYVLFTDLGIKNTRDRKKCDYLRILIARFVR